MEDLISKLFDDSWDKELIELMQSVLPYLRIIDVDESLTNDDVRFFTNKQGILQFWALGLFSMNHRILLFLYSLQCSYS